MNLEQLHTFLAIARHSNFSRAAGEHKLTQPGLSRQIQRLEKEMGVELLQRHRSRLELTLAGEKFRLYAENVLAQRFITIPGVSTVQIWGQKKYSMRVWMEPAKLAAYKLTPLDVQQAIEKARA